MVILVGLVVFKYNNFSKEMLIFILLWIIMFFDNSLSDWVFAIWVFLGFILQIACRDTQLLEIPTLSLLLLTILFLLPNLGSPYALGRPIFGVDVFLPGYASTAILIFSFGTYFTNKLKNRLALVFIAGVYTLLLLQTGVKTYTFLFILNTALLFFIRVNPLVGFTALGGLVMWVYFNVDYSEVDLLSVSGRLPSVNSTADFYGYHSVSEYWWNHSFIADKIPYDLETMPAFDGVIWLLTYFGGYAGLLLLGFVIFIYYTYSKHSNLFSKLLVLEMCLLLFVSNYIDSMYVLLLYPVINNSKVTINAGVLN